MSNHPPTEPFNCGYEVKNLEHDARYPIHLSNERIPFYDQLITKYGPGNSAADNDAIAHMLGAMRIQQICEISPPCGRVTKKTTSSATTPQNTSGSDTQPPNQNKHSSPSPPLEIEDLGSTYVEDHVLRYQIHDLYLCLCENLDASAFNGSEISAKVQMGWFDTIIEEMSVKRGIILNRKDVWKALALRDAEVRSMEYERREERGRGGGAGGCVGDLW